MSLFDNFIAASDAYDAYIQSYVPRYNDLAVATTAIDATAADAQEKLNVQVSAGKELGQDFELRGGQLRLAIFDTIVALENYTGPDRADLLSGVSPRENVTKENLNALWVVTSSHKDAVDTKQLEINNAKLVNDTPTPTTPGIVGGIPPGTPLAPPKDTAPISNVIPQQVDRSGRSAASILAKKQNTSLTNFIANLKSRGIPTAAHYYVQIVGIANREVWMMCEQALLPGINVMTAEVRTYGEIRESPYGITYQPANLTFLLDNKMDGKRLFEDWSNKIFDRTTRTSGYYDDYVGAVRIFQTDADMNVIYGVELKEAFPKTIQDINLGYENKELLKLSVAMAFKYWVEIDYLGNEVKSQSFIKKKYEDAKRLEKDINRINRVPTEKTVESQGEYDVGDALVNAGESLTAKVGVASSQVAAAAQAAGQGSLASAFSSLTNSIGQLGGGVAALGQNLSNVMSPVSQLGQASAAIAGTLGSINGLLGGLGMGTPLSGAIGQFTKLGGQFGQVAGLNGVPQLLGSTGSSLSGLAGTFTTLGASFAKAPGSISSLSKSVTNLGGIMSGNATQIGNAASKLY